MILIVCFRSGKWLCSLGLSWYVYYNDHLSTQVTSSRQWHQSKIGTQTQQNLLYFECTIFMFLHDWHTQVWVMVIPNCTVSQFSRKKTAFTRRQSYFQQSFRLLTKLLDSNKRNKNFNFLFLFRKTSRDTMRISTLFLLVTLLHPDQYVAADQ